MKILTVNPASGSGAGQFIVTIPANDAAVQKTHNIRITASKTGFTSAVQNISIIQAASAYVFQTSEGLTLKVIEVQDIGLNQVINITSTKNGNILDFSINCQESWITCSEVLDTNNMVGISITVEANSNTSTRTGTITLTQQDSNNTIQITVTQAAAARTSIFTLSDNSTSQTIATYSNTAGTDTITGIISKYTDDNSSIEYTCTSKPSWVSVNISNNTVTINREANTTTTTVRSGTIVLTQTGTNKTITINVSQAEKDMTDADRILNISDNSSITANIRTYINGVLQDDIDVDDGNTAVTLTSGIDRIDSKITDVQGYGALPTGYSYVIYRNEHDGETLTINRPTIMSNYIEHYVEGVSAQMPAELFHEIYAVKDSEVDYNNLTLLDVLDHGIRMTSIYVTINTAQ